MAALYTVILFPTDTAGGASIINGYTDATEADTAGAAAVAGSATFFADYIVVPGPTVADQVANVYQPGAAPGGSQGQNASDSR